MLALPAALLTTKKCPKCKIEKAINEGFSRSSSTKDGFQGHCRECRKSYYIKSIDTYRNKHKEKYAKYSVLPTIFARTTLYWMNIYDNRSVKWSIQRDVQFQTVLSVQAYPE